MRCPECRTELPDGSRFCKECGRKLELTCLECGNTLPPDSKFCLSCGHDLSRAVEGPTVDYNQPHIYTQKHLADKTPASRTPVDAERKHVTALFSDLTGYTAMTERLDPEQVKEITGCIFTGVRQIVAKYEGFIERVMGDGCLAFFGIPRAHEDDPIRAIHSALEIHDLVKGLSPQYESRVGAPLTMHSGINTGLVVTADVDPEQGTHGVAGDAVNVASRLSGMAGPGEIFVGEETVRRTKGRFSFDDLGLRQAKGKAEPVKVFRVVSAKGPAKGIGTDRQVFSEMVGRDRQLDRLEFQVMKAINGEGSVVNVIGEAGIGKSRLIAELKKSHTMKRVTLLEGRAISIGKNLSFHPIIDLLKQWAGIAEGDSEAAAFDRLEKAIRAVHPQESGEILPFVGTLMGIKLTGKHAERMKGIEGEALEKLIFKNVRELVIKGAELRPTVVVVEDLHWADTSSVELLDGLYRLAEKHRIAFINVFRPGYFESSGDKIAAIGHKVPARFVEITLQPLDKNDSETLIENMLAIKGLPYSLKLEIVERAGGNPFFIEEVVRSLIDEGAVVRLNGGFEVTEKIDKVVIPPTINDVLMARIDRLEDRTRELVKTASVIGRSFFDRIIKDVADSIDDVDHRLAYLKDVQLIRDRMRMQELEYLFKHALAQEAAYESTLFQQRKALHLKVAQSIEKLFQERLHEFYGMLAYHYSKGEDPEKAEEYMTKAGEEALRSSASSEALGYFQDALGLYTDKYGERADPEKVARLEKSIGLALFNKGQGVEAVKYFDRVLEKWGAGGPSGNLGLVAKAIWNLLIVLTNLYLPWTKTEKKLGTRDLEIIELGQKRILALANTDARRGIAETLVMLRKVMGADLGGVPCAVEMFCHGAGAFCISGFSFGASKRFLELPETLMDRTNIRQVTVHMSMRTVHNCFSGEWRSLEPIEETALDDSLRDGGVWHVIAFLIFCGRVRAAQGEFEAARAAERKLAEIGEVFEHDLARVWSYTARAELLLREGRFTEVAPEVNISLVFAKRLGLKPTQVQCYGYRAIVGIMLNNPGEAEQALLEAQEIVATRHIIPANNLAPYLLGRLLTDLHLLKEAIATGKTTESVDPKRAYQSAGAALRNAWKYAPFRTWILRLMGDYYWLVGKQRKALKWWDRSIKEGERLGARPDLSRTYFEVGKHLLEPQSKYKQLNGIDAKRYLDKAEVLFREMGLERDLEDLERVRSEYGS